MKVSKALLEKLHRHAREVASIDAAQKKTAKAGEFDPDEWNTLNANLKKAQAAFWRRRASQDKRRLEMSSNIGFDLGNCTLEQAESKEKTCLTCGECSPALYTDAEGRYFHCCNVQNKNHRSVRFLDNDLVVCKKWKSLEQVMTEEEAIVWP